MSITLNKALRAGPMAAFVVAGFGAAATPAQASETWRFERERGGGYAQSCDRFGGQRVCATVYCGKGVDGFEIGLTGWDARGRGDQRSGRIEVDGRGRNATFVRTSDGVVGDVWRAEVDRGTDRLIDSIQAGRRLSMGVAARGPTYQFTLNGSSAAISQLERRCARTQPARGDRPGLRADLDDGVIRFGNDEFGFQIHIGGRDHGGRNANFGRDWSRIGKQSVDRQRDRDVIQLDRSDGRFHAIRLRALENDVQIRQVKVRYGNGKEQTVRVGRRINEGDYLDVMQLRGRQGRFIDRIVLIYDTRGRGPRADIEVWGQQSQKQSSGPGYGPRWEKLASNDVDRRRDRDVIQLSRRDGRFDALRLRALGNDVRVRQVRVRYGNGTEHAVDVDNRINQGEASSVIDLRGAKGRFIDRIVLVYDSRGGGIRAEVEVWGRAAG